jgi:ribosomal protein L31E
MPEEKIITINLRKKLLKVPRWRRAKDQMKFLKELLKKKIKAENIKIGKGLNEKVWSRSASNPVMKIRIKLTKDDKTTTAELME